ncbi:winged helix-turn-helix domain-containing protein [Streptomyces sp. NPDC093970]|uniref:winged helix-turn-helix domain-containing protein n=1 Tax=Streptomyces sp. NPDC093970 TaxID=3155076 RepID=UPI003432AAC8
MLETVSDAGPAAFGWSDQCWTLARIAEIVRRHFGVEYTLAGLDLLPHRIGWSVQMPSRRTRRAHRGEDRRLEGRAVARNKKRAADLGAWLCFEDQVGQGLRQPKGRTPVVRVTAHGTKRVSMAALIRTKAGHRPRLIEELIAETGLIIQPP